MAESLDQQMIVMTMHSDWASTCSIEHVMFAALAKPRASNTSLLQNMRYYKIAESSFNYLFGCKRVGSGVFACYIIRLLVYCSVAGEDEVDG
jgi:hypothetical protein